MMFKITTLAAIAALIASANGKALDIRRATGTGTGTGVATGTGTGTGFVTGTGIVTATSVAPFTFTAPLYPTTAPTHTGPAGLPVPTTYPDSAIAFQGAGCDTNGTGVSFGWFNFPTGQCQVLFPSPRYEFRSLWVKWDGPQYDSCSVQVYTDNNCEIIDSHPTPIGSQYGGCVDSGFLNGKSFKLNCYNTPLLRT